MLKLSLSDQRIQKMKGNKFPGFSPVSKQGWIDQAKQDLKGGDFEKQLVSKTPEGFSVFPYYNAEDGEKTRWVKTYDNRINPVQEIPGASPRHWVNAVELGKGDEAAINSEIKMVLENGADGLILSLEPAPDFDQVFKDILFPYISIWLKPSIGGLGAIKAFEDWLRRQDVDHAGLRGGVLWDVLTVGFEGRVELEEQLDALFSLHQLFQPYPNFKSICLDSAIYAESGATAVQELGYSLAALVELWDGLTERGASPNGLFADFFVSAAVGSDYFMEIAKLKTFRIAVHQLALLYQANLAPEDIQLLVRTSRWTKSATEPYNNLLRNTTEAMAAILGGCNALFVQAHDRYSQDPGVFSKRMARNISLILQEEAHLDKALDPAAGSYYIESLVDSLYGEAIQLLQTLEAEGGWWKAYANRSIQHEIKAARSRKISQLALGNIKKLGLKAVGPDKTHSTDFPEEDYQLKPFSPFLLFEQAL